MEYSQIFVDFEENKKKRSFKRKMVLDITPNTKFVYSLKFGTKDFLKSSVPNCFLQNPDKATIMETDIRKGVECI